MSTAINPAGAPDNPRIGAEPTPTKGARRQPDADQATNGTDSTTVTISDQAATVSETVRLTQSENLAAARGSVTDISRASDLVKALAGQISEKPALAHGVHRISPKSALSLLS